MLLILRQKLIDFLHRPGPQSWRRQRLIDLGFGGLQMADKGARASRTPFISSFTPAEMLTLAREAGFKEVRHVSAATLAQRYFAGRMDGLRPPNNSAELIVATTT